MEVAPYRDQGGPLGPLLLPLLIIANLFGVGMIVPQVLRIHRTRAVDGVSTTWIGVSLALNIWWLFYALQGRLWGLVPVSAGALVLYAIVATQVVSVLRARTVRRLLVSGVGFTLLPLAALAVAGWAGVGLTLGLAYGLQFSPAVIDSMRSTSVVGISPGTWMLAVSEAAIWLLYGLVVADQALIIGGAGGAFMASVILVRLALTPVHLTRAAVPAIR